MESILVKDPIWAIEYLSDIQESQPDHVDDLFERVVSLSAKGSLMAEMILWSGHRHPKALGMSIRTEKAV